MAKNCELLRVGLSSGTVVEHDAISDSLTLKSEILADLERAGLPVDTTVFTEHCDREIPSRVCAAPVGRILLSRAFADVHVHVFEFGMSYDLFDASLVIPNRAAAIGVYHNLTPREHVARAEVKDALTRAEQQRWNLLGLGTIACDSEYNRDELLRCIAAQKHQLFVLHLPGRRSTWTARPRSRPRDGVPVRFVFVGRFVRAKGILDLLEAIRRLRGVRGPEIQFTLIGAPRFSDPTILAEVEDVHGTADGIDVRFLGELDDAALDRELRRADALVMPSYHEGLCLPVVEAMRFGCDVIAYDAGNLPHVTGGLGHLVPTGDVIRLADAMHEYAERALTAQARGDAMVSTTRGDLSRAEWSELVQQHLRAYSPAEYRARFLRFLRRAAQRLPGGAPGWMSELSPT